MLYLVDKPFEGVAKKIIELDEESIVVLIKDGIYVNVDGLKCKKVYAMEDDAQKRGFVKRLKEKNVELIDYSKLVDLIEENKVANFA